MSNSSNTTASFSTFRSILDAALKEYKKTTGQDLQTHPLTGELDHCDFPDAILEIFQQQANALDETGKCNQTLMKWLNPTVHILFMFSATLGEGVGSVSFSELIYTVSPSITFYFQPFFCGKIIFTGIYVLLGVHFSPMLHCPVFLVTSVSFRLLRMSQQATMSLPIFSNASRHSSHVSMSILASRSRTN